MVVTAAEEAREFVPPQPPPRWWLRIGLSLVVVAALIAGGVWAYHYRYVRCADGVSRQGEHNECIGVTDGSFHFHSAPLADVISKIKTENDNVEDSKKPWVAIAYVEPMTRGDLDKGWDSIREELQGAYLAQRELNSAVRGHGTTPQVKLLLANPGSGLEQWRPLVDQIVSMTHGAHPVVAVAGFGQSRLTTKHAVDRLREHNVPMVGSTVTADGLSKIDELGFFRAVAPNAAQAAAVVHHLVRQQKDDPGFTVQLVKDRNAKDTYTHSLSTGFVAAAKRAGLKIDPEEPQFFSTPKRDSGQLRSVANEVCRGADSPDAIYFAGRGRDLYYFIVGAGENGRHCPVTVYTGDDAVGMFFGRDPLTHHTDYMQYLRQWKDSRVRVKYTALAHPDAAADIYPDGQNPYPAFAEAYSTEKFGGKKQLLNGQAMLGHDAVLAVGTAIRAAAGSDGDEAVHPDNVRNRLLQIRGPKKLHGVAGPIDFDDSGNPRHKPLPLVELHPRDHDAYEYLNLVRP